MNKISLIKSLALAFSALAGLFIIACSQEPATGISGIWRSEEDRAGKNLVIEFVPDGSGKVFSGSIIGFPAQTIIEWQRNGDQIELQAAGDDSMTQTVTVLSQTENTLEVNVNRTKLTLVRVDNLSAEDAQELLY